MGKIILAPTLFMFNICLFSCLLLACTFFADIFSLYIFEKILINRQTNRSHKIFSTEFKIMLIISQVYSGTQPSWHVERISWQGLYQSSWLIWYNLLIPNGCSRLFSRYFLFANTLCCIFSKTSRSLWKTVWAYNCVLKYWRFSWKKAHRQSCDWVLSNSPSSFKKLPCLNG